MPGVDDMWAMRARIRVAVAAAFAVDEELLTPATSLYDDIGADSLAVMELLTQLETDLELELPESTEFALTIRTVGDLVEAFESRAS